MSRLKTRPGRSGPPQKSYLVYFALFYTVQIMLLLFILTGGKGVINLSEMAINICTFLCGSISDKKYAKRSNHGFWQRFFFRTCNYN